MYLYVGIGGTGLGMVTPLGCGVEATWKRLIVGECGVRAITPQDLKMSEFDEETRLHTYDQLTSKVAATVPCGTNSDQFNEEIWLNSKVFPPPTHSWPYISERCRKF